MEENDSGGKKPPFFYPQEEDTQLSEEEKIEREKIANSIMASFDKVSQRYFERYIGAVNRATPNWKKVLDDYANQLSLLLSKRACEPGFYRDVLKKTSANKKLKRQRATLTKAFLLSMLRQEGFLLKEIIEKPLSPKEKGPELYTRRQVQRIIRGDLPDAFFEIEPAPMIRKMNENIKAITSIFSSREMPKTDISDAVSKYAKLDKQFLESNSFAVERIRHNAEIQPIMPEYVEDLISFRAECREIVAKENFLFREKYHKYLCTENGNFTLLFEVFYRQVSSIIAQEWFSQRPPDERTLLIAKLVPFKYKLADAVKARESLLVLLQPEQQVNFLMAMCAVSLQEQGFFDQSVMIHKEILKSENLTPIEKGVLLENIAMIYRNSERFKLMTVYMKKAFKEYELGGDLYRVSVALKNIGEAEWNMGFKKKADEYFRKAEENVPKLNGQMERFGVFWNLASAFRRIGDAKSESKYLTKCLETLPDSETDKILTIGARLRQLDRLL
jgi:tetratricopeptide (TPR) repeat protein